MAIAKSKSELLDKSKGSPISAGDLKQLVAKREAVGKKLEETGKKLKK